MENIQYVDHYLLCLCMINYAKPEPKVHKIRSGGLVLGDDHCPEENKTVT